MMALTVGAARNIAVLVVVVLIVLAIVAARMITNITTKVVTLLLIAGLAIGAWTQRNEVGDCARQVKDQAAAGQVVTTTCRFFGTDVSVDLPGR